MAAPLIPLKFPAGMNTNDAEYSAKGRWVRGNLVRWVDGAMRPVGGWEAFGQTVFPEATRALLAWQTNAGQTLLAVGTASHLYVHDGSQATDITPNDLAAGRGDGQAGLGFGSDDYGTGDYGVPRSSGGGLSLAATAWDLDTWGEQLVAFSPADGRIFLWATGDPEAAEINPAAPIDNSGVVVTDERFVMALGADGDPRRVSWCSQEDYTTWSAASNNTAGSFQLETDGHIMAGVQLPGEVLVFTSSDVHAVRYVGSPYIYGRERLGRNCGIIARKAHAEAEGFCVWMTREGFMLYDGRPRALPCEVWRSVFDNLNEAQASKIFGGANVAFGEVWFFYPSASSGEVDRYVVWNYRENWWATGGMDRTAWIDRGAWPLPVAAGADKKLYQHETGWAYPGRLAPIYAESAPFDLGNGDQVLQAKQLLPDTNSAGAQALSYTFKLRFTPQGAEHVAGPYMSQRGDGYMDVRFAGRQAVLRVESVGAKPFQLGTIRLAAQGGGRR